MDKQHNHTVRIDIAILTHHPELYDDFADAIGNRKKKLIGYKSIHGGNTVFHLVTDKQSAYDLAGSVLAGYVCDFSAHQIEDYDYILNYIKSRIRS